MDLSQKGMTHQQIMSALRMIRGSRQIRFRYDLLNQNHAKIRELKTVESGSVRMDAFSSIKRTAKFQMKEEVYEIMSYYTWRAMDDTKWSDM